MQNIVLFSCRTKIVGTTKEKLVIHIYYLRIFMFIISTVMVPSGPRNDMKSIIIHDKIIELWKNSEISEMKTLEKIPYFLQNKKYRKSQKSEIFYRWVTGKNMHD